MIPLQRIIEASNPQQTLTAWVEQDARTAYFYIQPVEAFRNQFAVRGCWLRNLLPAPEQDDQVALAQGLPPLLSARYCRTLEAEPQLDPAGIQIVWEPAGDGASLWYRGLLMAVIPGWSLYQHEQVSFSAGCIRANRLTAPLGSASTNDYYALAVKHRQFWSDWQDDARWSSLQRELLQHYGERFGESLKYYAVGRDSWPPVTLSQHYHEGCWYFFTLGMSIRPMPWVRFLYGDSASSHSRIELALAVDATIMTEQNAVQMAGALFDYACLPWDSLSWLGEGHTLASAVAPAGYEGFLFSALTAQSSHHLILPQVEAEKVSLLWAMPVTQREREFAQGDPQGGSSLIEHLHAQDAVPVFRVRTPVINASE